MTGNLLLRGLILGLSIAAPVGPIGVLCIRRTLSDGQIQGLISGLGAATADAIYGAIAGFGFTLVTSYLVQQQTWLRLIGGAFLCYLGIKTFFSQPEDSEMRERGRSWAGAYISTFVLTLTNPVTIISFAAIFAGVGLGSTDGDYRKALTLVLGVFLGSTLWWLLLSTMVGIFRKKFTMNSLGWLNRISGVIIVAFGVVSFVSFILLES